MLGLISLVYILFKSESIVIQFPPILNICNTLSNICVRLLVLRQYLIFEKLLLSNEKHFPISRYHFGTRAVAQVLTLYFNNSSFSGRVWICLSLNKVH